MERYNNADLISRQDAIEAVIKRIEKSECGESVDHNKVLADIKSLPSADVVEVVRCKDCKFRKIEFGWNGKRYKMCANTDYPTDDDAYCSYGERREDG